jgi:hypothetical protein
VELIDGLVAGQHLGDQRCVAGDQALKGSAHAFLGEPTHFEQSTLERFELLAEVRDLPVHQPNLPVT